MLQYTRLGRGRRIHILDTTGVEVPLETGTYERSGVVKNDDGTLSRGSKLAPLRTLLDSAGLLTQVALSAIQMHDVALCRPLLEKGPCYARVICEEQIVAFSMGRRCRS